MAATPNSVTLAQLIANARSLCDMVNSEFVSDDEFTVWANKGYAKLYDLLISSYGTNYYVAQPFQFITNGNQQLYPLPDGTMTFFQPALGTQPAGTYVVPAFYKLLGADISYNGGLGGDPNSFITMYPFMFGDRNRANGVYGVVSRGYNRSNDYRYRLQGNQFFITPNPQGGFCIQVWIAPCLIPLVAPTDIVEGVSGWEEVIEFDMAIKALVKEESDPSALMAMRNETVQRIIALAGIRDAGAAEYVRDVYGPASGNGFPGYGGSAYGGNFGTW